MENNIGKEFINLTKYENLEPSAQSQGEPIPALELSLPEGIQAMALPHGKSIQMEKIDLANLVEKRKTLRKYSQDELTQEELAFLLWGTQGVKTITKKPVTFRTVPSAGARHPFETYLIVNRVKGFKPGLYRYLAINHQIAKLPAQDSLCEQLTEACLKQQHVFNSAVTFIWVANVQRTIWRYCQRGYRYLYLDAGHVCQNLYLLAESIGCGVCAIGAYDDDAVNNLFDLDGVDQFVIYMATLGKRAQS